MVEPTGRIGGMMTHGLSHSDFYSFEALNGPFLQFSQRVLKHYQVTYGEDSAQAKDSWQGTHGEPSVNLLIFQQMLAERPTITVLTNHRLVEVDVENSAITALHFVLPETKKVTVKPRLVIDATYEGDLLAAAKVPYRVCRETKSEYSESLAPEAADAELQGYNYRLCMTQNPANRVPVPVPDNYNREDYAAIGAWNSREEWNKTKPGHDWLFAWLDKNTDGKISEAEYLELLAFKKKNSNWQKLIREEFGSK